MLTEKCTSDCKFKVCKSSMSTAEDEAQHGEMTNVHSKTISEFPSYKCIKVQVRNSNHYNFSQHHLRIWGPHAAAMIVGLIEYLSGDSLAFFTIFQANMIKTLWFQL